MPPSEAQPDAPVPADFEWGSERRYVALAGVFDGAEEVLATWGMTGAMPRDIRADVFNLWSDYIEKRGGGSHSAAKLRTDRATLDEEPARIDKIPLRGATHRNERFQILYSAIDREGEVLALWGMTSWMPVQLRTHVFDIWRARIERDERNAPGGDTRRSLLRLEADIKQLAALRNEPSA